MNIGLTIPEKSSCTEKTPGQCDYVYAPTLLGGGGACVEVTTVYTDLQPQIWAEDWCSNSSQPTIQPLSAQFLAESVRDLGDGHPRYSVEIILAPDGKHWLSQIYNYSRKQWVKFYLSPSIGSRSNKNDVASPEFGAGWDMFENWVWMEPQQSLGQATLCRNLTKSFSANNIVVSFDPKLTSFSPITPDDSPILPADHTPSIDACASLKFSTIQQDYYWQVVPT